MSEKIVKSDAEWREQLSDLAYKVTRKHGTERAGTHEDFPKESGTYTCVCCGAPLFDQDTKFDSGTGWPSFYQPLDQKAVGESVDLALTPEKPKQFFSRTGKGAYSKALYIGPDDVAKGTARIKDMQSGEQSDFPLA